MTGNDSWIYQGRQEHGWFGDGTSPKADAGDVADRSAGLFSPASAGRRVDYVAASLIMHVPSNERSRWTGAVSDAALGNLKTAVAAWYGARSLSREAFRTQFFTPYTSDAVIDDVRAAARGMIEGRSYDELAMAAGELATAARTVGADNWQRFLGSSSRQAVEAVSRGEVPGVVKIGAEAEVAGVARLTVLGLLAIMHGFRPHPPHPRPAPSLPGIVLQEAPKDAKTAPQRGQDGGGGRRSLPADPDDLVKEGWIETTHPEAAAEGHRDFVNPETGEEVGFDKSKPGLPGFRGKDHYHQKNPNAIGKRDLYLDVNGNPVAAHSKASHILPGQSK